MKIVRIDDKGHVDYFPQACAIIWQPADIMSRACDNQLDISENDAIQILNVMESKKDASIGITWETIDYLVDELMETRR